MCLCQLDLQLFFETGSLTSLGDWPANARGLPVSASAAVGYRQVAGLAFLCRGRALCRSPHECMARTLHMELSPAWSSVCNVVPRPFPSVENLEAGLVRILQQ